jgi:hypothetical protein
VVIALDSAMVMGSIAGMFHLSRLEIDLGLFNDVNKWVFLLQSTNQLMSSSSKLMQLLTMLYAVKCIPLLLVFSAFV